MAWDFSNPYSTPQTIQALTATGNISATGGSIVTFSGAAAQTITLPTATTGMYYKVFNVDASDSVTLDANGAETINGVASWDIPAGANAEVYCTSTGVWFGNLNASVYGSSAGQNMVSTTLTTVTGCSLTLGPGRWHLSATGYWDVSTAANYTYTARFQNTTDATEVYRTQATQTALTWQAQWALVGRISLTATKTIAVQVAPSTVGGTQLVQDVDFIAVAV